MRKLLALSSLVVGLSWLAASPAHAFGVGADAGLSRVMNDPGKNGFGLNVYIRPLPLPFIEPELQLGMHRFTFEGGTTSMNIPVMVGGRFDLPVPTVSPFVGAHAGIMHGRVSLDGADGAQTENDFAFNIGGGLSLLNLPLISLGVSAWYYIISSDFESTKMLTAGIDASFGF